MVQLPRYKAIFTPASPSDRRRVFEDYWAYLLVRDGALHEEAQALEHKTEYYQRLQARPVHARQSLTPVQTMAAPADLLAT
jgi:hypothetical protein